MMKKLNLVILLAATVSSGIAGAQTADEKLLERNNLLDEMAFKANQYKHQATMAKSIKEMVDAGFIVDSDGQPMGIGNMESLASEVRKAGGVSGGKAGDPGDMFGSAPMLNMPGMFNQPQVAPQASMPAGFIGSQKDSDVEDIRKPSANELASGKQVLRLVEIRNSKVVFFTNEGFKEVRVGEKVYDLTLKSIGVESAALHGPNGNREVRIDWTKSVRYTDN